MVMETADHDVRELQGPPTTAVNKLNRCTGKSFSTGPRPTIHKNLQNNYYRCGGKHSVNFLVASNFEMHVILLHAWIVVNLV